MKQFDLRSVGRVLDDFSVLTCESVLGDFSPAVSLPPDSAPDIFSLVSLENRKEEEDLCENLNISSPNIK